MCSVTRIRRRLRHLPRLRRAPLQLRRALPSPSFIFGRRWAYHRVRLVVSFPFCRSRARLDVIPIKSPSLFRSLFADTMTGYPVRPLLSVSTRWAPPWIPFLPVHRPLGVLVGSGSEPTRPPIRHQPKVEEDVSFAIRSLWFPVIHRFIFVSCTFYGKPPRLIPPFAHKSHPTIL
jgi:hypothetical protein